MGVALNEMPPVGHYVSGERKRIGAEDRVLKPYKVKKVIILGMGFSIVDYVQRSYDKAFVGTEEGTEVWAINYGAFPFRCNLCFNIHNLDDGHDERFKAYALMPEVKVVSIRSYDWLPNSYEYPMQEIIEDEMCGLPYLKNTTAYVLAFAIACRAETIEMYGCDFSYDKELTGSEPDRYESGRANVEFWLGMASARGISVFMAPLCNLLGSAEIARESKINFYGYGKYEAQWDFSTPGKLKFNGWQKNISMKEAEAMIEKDNLNIKVMPGDSISVEGKTPVNVVG